MHDPSDNQAGTHGESRLEHAAGASQLALMVGHRNTAALQRFGGISGVAAALETNLVTGIPDPSPAGLVARRLRHGRNELPPVPMTTFWEFVQESLEDRTMRILIGAAILSLVLGMTTADPHTGRVDWTTGWIEGAAILASVVVVTLVTAINNLQKQAQFAALQSAETVAAVGVIRAGIVTEVPCEDVVAGDIVFVYAGMSLPFDALLLEGIGFSANEANMTGEADDVSKTAAMTNGFVASGAAVGSGVQPRAGAAANSGTSATVNINDGFNLVGSAGTPTSTAAAATVSSDGGEQPQSRPIASPLTAGLQSGDPFLISGTHIVDGTDGVALVVAVGPKSVSGSITMASRGEKKDTPLQEQLTDMADVIGRFGLAAAVVTFLALLLKEVYFFVVYRRLNLVRIVENLTTSVAIVVVAVPEGLPLSVTLSLAYSIKQMLKDQNLVRHLAACETMGGATCVCTDKTGTLTTNDMTVSSLCVLGAHHAVTDHGSATTRVKAPTAPASSPCPPLEGASPGLQQIGTCTIDGLLGSPIELAASAGAIATPIATPGVNGLDARSVVLMKVADCIAFNYGGGVGNKTNKTSQALLRICEAVRVATGYDGAAAAAAIDKASIQRFAFSSIRKRGSVVVAEPPTANTLSARPASGIPTVHLTQALAGPPMPGTSSGAVAAGGGVVVTHYVCGAAEVIVQKCVNHIDATGRRVALNAESKAFYDGAIADYTRRGLRTLCLALSERRTTWVEPPRTAPEDPLTILAIVGIAEPLRCEVPGAIAACQRAGVRVIVVTGDSLNTASHVAEEAGIIQGPKTRRDSSGDAVMVPIDAGAGVGAGSAATTGASATTTTIEVQDAPTAAVLPPCLQRFGVDYPGFALRDGVVIGIDGATFRECSDEDLLTDVLPHLAVLARAVPLDKKRLVDLLHTDRDAVIATTGDGTNDAPALKAADVGFAMNSGSDIAKQASDIVLLDDNFHGVVKAVVWGRNVRNNIRKFLQFQMTVNFVACVLAFVGAVVNEQNLSPLKPVQLLWLNLIMDTFAALALATELPDEAALLSRGPEPRTAPIITPGMRVNIAVQGLWQLALQSALLLWADDVMPELAAASAEQAAVLRAAAQARGPTAGLSTGTTATSLTGAPEIKPLGPAVTFTPLHITMFFNTFVLLQLFNFFNARKLTATAAPSTGAAAPHGMKPHHQKSFFTSGARGAAAHGTRKKKRLADRLRNLLERSRVMLYIVCLIAILQILIVQHGGRFMSTVPLSLSQWAVCVALGSTSLAVGAWGRQRWIQQSRFASLVFQLFTGALSCLGRAETLVGRIMASVMNPIYARLPGGAPTQKGKEQ